ncbi:MAG: S8 family serine peptidase [Bacteroidota bacterium]
MIKRTLHKPLIRLSLKTNLLLLLFVFCAFAGYSQQDQDYKPGELIIKLNRSILDQANLEDGRVNPDLIGHPLFDAISRNAKASTVRRAFRKRFKHAARARALGLDQYITVKVPNAAAIQELISKYEALQGIVEVVELNYMATAHVTPNDPLYGEQWGLNNTGNAKEYNSTNLVGTPGADLNLEAAWDIHTGTSAITIAIIDSGVDGTHPEFAGRMVPGYDFVNNDNDPSDNPGDGHGTSCAGIAAAAGNNGFGVAGVNWGAKIMPLKALQDGTGSFQDIADAVIFAVDNGADVISMSLGGGSSASVLANAINYAYNSGVAVFASRGNGDSTADNYPSSYSTVISVGGLSPCDTRKTPTSCDGEFWWGASYGGGPNKMDFVAPAARITTTDITGSGGYSSGDYTDSFNGTSSACPYAAGIGALVLSYNPTLTPDELRDILRNTSVDIGAAGYDAETGYGRLDAAAALMAALPCTLGAPGNLSASSITDNSFNISWNAVSGAASYTVTLDGNPTTVSGTSASVTGLTPGTTYAITVAADCASGGSGSVSNINVTTTGSAPITCNGTVSSYPYGEGFESGDGWTQASGDDGNWFRDANGTPSGGTGPSSAVEGTWYLFLEASTNGSPGQIGNNATAILESPCFDLSGETSASFSFQNHMYGTAVGSLTVEATTNDQNWTQLWTDSGNKGNQWNSVTLSLDAYAGGTVKLRIVGTTGNGWSSDIAIDDLAVTTSGGPSCDTPTGLTVTAVGTTTASIDWNDVAGVVDYTVRWRAIGTSTWSQGNITSSGGAFSNLTPGTNYETQVRANCGSVGSSAFTNSVNFTTDPVSSGGCNDVVDSNGFESGWGIWNDGGSDARRSANDAAYSNGTYSIRLRDNTSTSTMTTDNINLTTYDEIKVNFSFYARSMESGEDFWLQISNNGGSSYTTVGDWNQGAEFVNNQRYDGVEVTIPGPFASNTRLRFRCDASGNSDWVYIDDVVITGCTSGSSATAPIMLSVKEEQNSITMATPLNNNNRVVESTTVGAPMDMTLFPNPVNNELNIKYQVPETKNNIQLIIMDLNGRTVQQRTLAGDIPSQQIQVDVSQLSNGFYFLHLISDENRMTKKFIVQNR